MMEYMINAGVFKSKAAQERESLYNRRLARDELGCNGVTLVEGLPAVPLEGAPHEESRESEESGEEALV
jgi:hypothetical protein